MNTVIKTENLGKKYIIDHQRRDIYLTLRDTIALSAKNVLSRICHPFSPVSERDGREEFWALKDVSIEVKEGDRIGIIGRNGAGKTTLLKILSRITEPTTGTALIRGRVGSLLEVGTGFHQELTGRENIFLSGAILGMMRREIKQKFDEIVAFSEVEKFLDTPMKRYSAGMRVRLAFAVAAHLEPEILLVDEVLAVGDAEFQKKCLGKMEDVSKVGRTVLFVSHNMAAISQLCQKAFWLDGGRLRLVGPTKDVVSQYMMSGIAVSGEIYWEEGISGKDVDGFSVKAVRIKNNRGEVSGTVDVSETFSVEVEYSLSKSLRDFPVGIELTSSGGIVMFESYDTDSIKNRGERKPGTYVSRCTIPEKLLAPDRYVITVNAGIVPRRKMKRLGAKNVNIMKLEDVLFFYIEDAKASQEKQGGSRAGILRPDFEWDVEKV
jgi:lipopolysaccharide transport system ATP-binding protein